MQNCPNCVLNERVISLKLLTSSLLIVFFLVGFSFNSAAQKIDIEVLKSEIHNLKGKSKVTALLQISQLYYDKFNLADSALIYANKSKALSEKIGDFDGTAKSILLQQYRSSDYEKSIRELQELLAQEKKIKDKNIVGEIQLSLASNYYVLGDFEKAFEHDNEAAAIFKENENFDQLTLAYIRIASIFTTQRLFEECASYQKMANETLPKTEKSFTKISFYSSALGQFVQMGFYEPNFLDSAIIYGEKGLKLAVMDEYYSKGFQLSNSLSTAYRLKGDMAKSLEYLLFAKQFSPYLHPEEEIVLYFGLTDYHFDAQNYEACLSYLDTVNILLASSDDHAYNMAFYQRVYEYNKELKNYKASLEGLEKFKAEEDSIFNIQNNEAILELNEKYQSDLKNAEITSLQQQKQIDDLEIDNNEAQIKWLIGLVLIALLTIVVFFVFYRQRQTKNQLKLLETEQQLNRARINPHFFFNAMASVQNIAIQEKSPSTTLFISRFSKIMRQSLENSYEELITLEDEIQFITDYIEIQKLRFPEKFKYQIEIDDELEVDELKIPSMLLQPFVENAIEHGFTGIDYQGEIQISVRSKGDHLQICIKDNGQGMASKKEQKNHVSRALQIIEERFRLFNVQHRSSANFISQAQENQKGFQIIINLPKIY